MDTGQDFHTFSSKHNPKLAQSSLSGAVYATNTPESDEQSLDLAWVFGVLRRRALVMVGVTIALTVAAGTVIVSLSRQTVYEFEGSFRLLVEPLTAEGLLARQYLLSQTPGVDVQRIRIEDNSLLDYETQIRVLRSPKLMIPVVKQLKSQYPKLEYNSLLSNFSINRVSYEQDGKKQGTKLLQVNYRDENPKKIQFVLEQLAKAYLEYSRQERIATLRPGLEFIDQQLPILRGEVDNLQQQMEQLRQQYNVLNPERSGNTLHEYAVGLERERVGVQAQLAETRMAYANLINQLRDGAAAAILANEGKAYEALIGQLQRQDTEMAIKSSLYLEESEPMKVMREKKESLMNLAQEEAQNAIERVAGRLRELEARDRSLAQAQAALDAKLSELPVVARQYADLERELQVATDSLKELLTKKQALEIDTAQQEIPWQLIEPPSLRRDANGNLIPTTFKQTKRQLLLAGILSFLVGVGAGFLVEVLITVFHSPEEIKGGTKLPLLAVIPFAKELKKSRKPRKTLGSGGAWSSDRGSNLLLARATTTQTYTSSPLLEAFRSLYTNLRLLSYEKPLHSLAIGAAEAGDGKSTVAVNLAQTAAAIGQRVLLVDADLRCPKIHEKLGLANLRGLSDTIATDISLNEVIQQSPVDDNLFVLTAGPLPNDPIKLLSSRKMQCLMEQFQDFFDLVIYDTPPLVGLADANILAAQSDGMLLVVALAQTDRNAVKKALEGLKISGATILGVAANGIRGYTPSTVNT
ncbi:MAG: polysaccharide biosynthesis tyrosine autokinase [Cyanobacteria bacterium J007]|nr:MAG: polysaccharide biosynthesis tyrosine autokinase [Cyanobacteria bacterium J007]